MTNAQRAEPSTSRTLDQTIGANIHTLMWHAQESQSRVAPLWGMSQAALSLKLRGKRPWFADEIDAAARHFQVTRDALFTKLPDLDSNQEPTGSSSGLALLDDYRVKKIEAHTAIASDRDATISQLPLAVGH